MKAMVLEQPGLPLALREVDDPHPGPGQVLLRVRACAVCRTDLHIVDGDLEAPSGPRIPGHEIVGEVIACGSGVRDLRPGQRAGVGWLGWTCGSCAFCSRGQENLCDEARYTGYHLQGGYAELAVADARYCFPIPDAYSDVEAAPLLCAGLIGYRCLTMTGDARRLGLYGFGAAAHIVAQIARYQGRSVLAFTRPGDRQAQDFARSLGAEWAGDSDRSPPAPLDAAILFAPVGDLVPLALGAVRKGGVVVCGGIHMSDVPSFSYTLLWGERILRSVANLTRTDGHGLLALAAEAKVRTRTTVFRLEQANEALDSLRAGRHEGAAVLAPTAD
ncbi:MAG: zinc-dependent alcohol dehydrogenase family protein [Acidobacteriota bacterium]|nr:zinc-dependent alcohol dehydrogenase family protein [Acidobacteriota bacterium]